MEKGTQTAISTQEAVRPRKKRANPGSKQQDANSSVQIFKAGTPVLSRKGFKSLTETFKIVLLDKKK